MEETLIPSEGIRIIVDRRLHELRMPTECLAQRAGLPIDRVEEILSSSSDLDKFVELPMLLESLGLFPTRPGTEDSEGFRKAQAYRKAEKLTSMVQGSCALEGQGVDETTFCEMVENTAQKLLADSDGRRLWTPL